MAFRTQRVPAAGLQHAKSVAASVKSYCQNRSAQFAATTNRDVVLATSQDLRRWRNELQAVAAVPGIGSYAQSQEDDGTYDVGAEFTAMNDAIDAVIAHIVSAFPVTNGAIAEKALNPDGTVTMLTFTAAQLGTARALLDAVVAAIE